VLASIPEFSHHILEIPDAQGQHTDFQTASILTAEIAAAAKVYLEIHFNSLLSPAGDARSQRCQALQAQLQRSLMSSKDRTEARQKWLQAETEHLRRTRVLKRTKDKRPDSLSIGHYDVVRVLGKGSFGVVRLVRNKLKADAVVSKTQSSNDLTSSANGAAGLNLAQLRNKVFAMKVIRKSAMLWNSQEGHLRAERDFLVASENSRWVVPLIESFQDFNHLYLVMEYMVGGDFLGLLLRWDVLPEAVARFYVAEMISCVEEAHKMKWIHRDVKPDNFLISSSGHLKISDFGLAFDGHWSHNQSYYNETRRSILEKLGIVINGDAKDIEERQEQENLQNLATATGNGESNYHWKPSDRPEGDFVLDKLNATWRRKLAKSVVGTSQYMAPEVIQGGYYDGRCDWWSIGIILYECLYGGTPFYCNNRDETKARIVVSISILSHLWVVLNRSASSTTFVFPQRH
jgi:protein-serine/threonine kinase